jgi:hypothetical protein
VNRRGNVTATQAATKAIEAADSLMAWLRAQPRGSERVAAAPASAEKAQTGAVNDDLAARDNPASLAQSVDPPGAAAPAPADGLSRHEPNAPLRLAHTDWLHHRLRIAGPVTELAALREAAAGAGTIPWHLDLDGMEEDLFHLLVVRAARRLSLAGARILAGQLRAAVARRHALAVGRVGGSGACPFAAPPASTACFSP